jgi:hypothetical protein
MSPVPDVTAVNPIVSCIEVESLSLEITTEGVGIIGASDRMIIVTVEVEIIFPVVSSMTSRRIVQVPGVRVSIGNVCPV